MSTSLTPDGWQRVKKALDEAREDDKTRVNYSEWRRLGKRDANGKWVILVDPATVPNPILRMFLRDLSHTSRQMDQDSASDE